MENINFSQNISVQFCYPGNNASCRKEVRAGPGYTLLFILLSCVSVCTVFLNLLVIISISHFKQLHTPTNLLILSLAVADLLVGLFVMPGNIMQLIDSCWYLGKVTCTLFFLVSLVSESASLCNLVFIAGDRYIAVSDPLRYSMRVTVRRTLLLIISGWSFCTLYIFSYMYFNGLFLSSQVSSSCYGECVIIVKYSWMLIDLVVFFITPCSTIMVLYSIIFSAARRQAKAVRAKVNHESLKQGTKVSSETKAAKTLGIVIFVYLACWIPFYLCSVLLENFATSPLVWNMFNWLMFLNSSANPLIYGIFYPWFRKSTLCIITCRICVSSSSRFNLL